MLLPIFALCTLVGANVGSSQTPNVSVNLMDKEGVQTGQIMQVADPLRTPELSPKKFGDEHWAFDWQTVAFENLIPATPKFPEGKKMLARFYVYSQERNPQNDAALGAARMLERMWEYLYEGFAVDHSETFGNGVVEVFLCKGGNPGGEQLYGADDINLKPQANGRNFYKVNQIYFYDLATFKDPIEMAREVAHEYGHASLGGVNGYSAPEDWANGYLGERVYLKHIADAMATKDLYSEDAMGATRAQIEAWLAKNVNPLVAKAAEMGPNVAALKRRDKQGMDNYLGVAMYIDCLYPPKVFSRSLQIMPSTNAEDYLDTVPIAVAEPEKPYTLNIPNYLSGKPLWLPLGDCRIVGARVIEHKGDWVRVNQTGGDIQIVPKHLL